MYFHFYGDDGIDSWYKGGSGTVESVPRFQEIEPGKEYKLVVSGLDSSDVYDLSVTSTPAYEVFITDAEGNDLIKRRKVADQTQVGTSDTYRIKILPRRSAASNPGFGNAPSIQADRPVWSIGMGRLENGDSAGSIHLRADEISDLAGDPSDLHYSAPSDEVAVILDPATSDLRQINAPQGLADIVYTSPDLHYEITFYSWMDVTGFSGGLYTVSGSATPVVSYTVKRSSSTKLDITKTVGSDDWKSRLWKDNSLWRFYDWTKNLPGQDVPGETNTERKVQTTVSVNGAVETRTQTEYGGGLSGGLWVVSSRTEYKYTDMDWGQELTEVTLDPDTSNPPASERRTTYTYHATGDGEKGQLKRVTRPDGGYTEYEYYNDFDKQGLIWQIKEPFEDTNAGRITTYTYTDDGTGDRFLPNVVTVTVSGNEVSKIDNDYATYTYNSEPVRRTTIKSYTNGSSYLTSYTFNYREDASDPYLRSKPYALIRPDKTQTSWSYSSQTIYTYYNGAFVWRTYKIKKAYHGSNKDDEDLTYSASNLTSADGDDIYDIRVMAKQSTADAEWVDVSGLVTNTYLYVCDTGTTFSLASGLAHGYQSGVYLASTSRATYKNGSWDSSQTIYDATYTNGQLTQSVDETGATKNYEYDVVGRVNKITEVGESSTTTPYDSPAIANREVLIYYDGSNRETKREIKDVGTSEKIISTFVYDLAGRLTSKTMDCCDTVTYAYDDPGLVETNNADGGEIIESYYRDGTLESRTGDATQPLYVRSQSIAHGMKVQTAMASITTFGNAYEGWRIVETDKLGRQVRVEEPTYDGGKRATVFYYYSSTGQHYKRVVFDATTSDTQILAPYMYTYDDLGRVKMEGMELDSGSDVLGETSSNDRLTKRMPEFEKDASGFWWNVVKSYAYPVAGQGAVFAGEARTRLAADSGELSRSITEDANGNESTTVVKINRTTAVVATETSYDPYPTGKTVVVGKLGLKTSEKEPSGVTQSYTYDGLWRLSSVAGRDSVVTNYEYVSGTNRVSKKKDGTLDNFHYYYTDARLTSIKRRNYAAAYSEEWTYNVYTKRGQIDRQHGSGTNPVNYDYDSYGRLIEQRQYRDGSSAVGTNDDFYSKVKWVYQANTGLMVEKKHHKTDSLSNSETFKYNDLGATTERKLSRYDDYGEEILKVNYTYSIGSATSTGELTKENPNDASDIDFTYDRMGRVKTVDDHTGLRTFHYNEQNNLALGWVDLDNAFYGTGNNIDHLYETVGTNKVPGRYRGIAYDGGTWSHTYESSSGRMDVFTAAHSGFSKTFNYAYDSDSNHVASMDGGSYDQFRYFESSRENYAGTHTTWNGSSRADYTAPNFTWQYQLRDYKLKGTSGNSNELSDKIGVSSSDITYSMTYDSRKQLSTWDVDHTSGTEGIQTWDSAGNPTSYYGQNYSVNGLNEIEPTQSGTQYTYDTDGNLKSDENWYYYYNASNRLKAMKKKTNDKYLRFYYDYMGRRVEKKVYNNSTGTGTPVTHLKFVYQGMTLIAELNSSGTIQKSFHWGLDKSDTHGGAGGAMGLLMMKIHSGSHAGEYYPAYDMNGNVTGILNSSGAFVAWYEYDGFGNIVTEGGVSGFNDVNPIRFSTQYTDEETGLVYYGFRYYDPSKGRFLNRDPIGEQGGLNLYRFVGNDPIHNVDVWGLCELPDDEGESVQTQAGADDLARRMRAYARCLSKEEAIKRAGGFISWMRDHGGQVTAIDRENALNLAIRDIKAKTGGSGDVYIHPLKVVGDEAPSLARSAQDIYVDNEWKYDSLTDAADGLYRWPLDEKSLATLDQARKHLDNVAKANLKDAQVRSTILTNSKRIDDTLDWMIKDRNRAHAVVRIKGLYDNIMLPIDIAQTAPGMFAFVYGSQMIKNGKNLMSQGLAIGDVHVGGMVEEGAQLRERGASIMSRYKHIIQFSTE